MGIQEALAIARKLARVYTRRRAPSRASVKAGQSTNFTLDASPTTATFANSVSLACSKLSALTTCISIPRKSRRAAATRS
jgi:hypothetical protein